MFRLTDDLACVLTVDFFTPIVDDPYDFGRIAAANALSDVYAMGGEPRVCLNLMAFPRALGLDVAAAVLRGSADVVARSGALVAGGHTVEDEEPKFGLCVMGVIDPARLLKNGGARPGDALFLTKPLGTGLVTTALKRGVYTEDEAAPAVELMATLNAAAAAGALVCRGGAPSTPAPCRHRVRPARPCARDVRPRAGAASRSTSAGCRSSTGALDLAARGVCPGKTRDVRAWAEGFARVVPAGPSVGQAPAGGEASPSEGPGAFEERARTAWNVLADPQTSGGLLVAVDPGAADAFEAELRAAGAPAAARIGAFVAGDSAVTVLL